MTALAAAPICTGPQFLPCMGVLGALTLGAGILGMSASSDDIDNADETPPGTLTDGETTDCVGQCSPDECAQLGQQIDAKAQEVQIRLEDMMEDQHDLYRIAPRLSDNFGRGTWEGHQIRYNREREELKTLIAVADANKCPVSDFAREVAEEEAPDRPFGR